jgi:50S ribosomal protein L16 3-hydroxylase
MKPRIRCGGGNVVFQEWLGPEELDGFRTNHFGRTPFARAGGAAADTSLFTWETVDRVLKNRESIDLMTVNAGRLVDVPRPLSLADVRRLMASGISVVIRAGEEHDLGLRALATAFEHELPGEVHVHLYVTPGGTNSYGWHYDFEDVFVVQTAGTKDYYFRANTVARDAVLGDRLDFSCVSRETSQIFSSRLVAGDWLYIPATWWHLVKCAEDALSISVGVMSPAALGRARRLPGGWNGPSQSGS